MMEVNVVLDYQCCACDQPVSVTLTCAGKNLSASPNVVAAVNVPCPTCGRVHQLLFEPTGNIVRAVRPYHPSRTEYRPSLN